MATDWREMTNAEREALPIGSEGWRYKRSSGIPKGQWVEMLAEPKVFANGAVCTTIRWCSNGAGVPTMNLIGSTKAVEPCKIVHTDGWYPMPPVAYFPMKPNQGDRSFIGDKSFKSRPK